MLSSQNWLSPVVLFPSAPLFVGKTDFFLSCFWLSFQIHFYFWPKQTGQCPAAELIVLLVGVPAVHHLLIPPDKLLPKFKDWLLFVLLLRVLALTPYLLWTNKDRICFCWLILGFLIRGCGSLGLCTWLAFAWISSLWDTALLISSERTGLLFPSCWIYSHLSFMCSLLYFQFFHSLIWKWFHFRSVALWIQLEVALDDFQYYLNYLLMLCCLLCDKQAYGLRAILLPQFWSKFLSIK